MSLPITADFPLVPIVMYQWNNFPSVPAITTPPGLQGLVGAVAVTVANEAGNRANSNAARMFTYNMLSREYWRNPEFAEVCSVVIGLIFINLRKQIYQSPEQGLAPAASQVLAMFASRYVLQYQGLVSKVDASVYQAAQMTAPILQDLTREINATQQNMHMGHQMNYPQQQQPMMVQTPRGIMSMQDAQNFGLPFQPVNGGMMPNGYPQQQMYPQQGYPQQQMNYGGSPYSHQQPMMHGTVFNQNAPHGQPMYGGTNEIEDQRFVQAAKNFELGQPQQAPQAAQVFNNEPEVHYRQPATQTQVVQVDTNTKELLIDKGSEMDRAKHELVYFGQTFKENLEEKTFMQTAQAEILSKAPANDPEEDLVSCGFSFEPSLQVAIATGEKKRLDLRTKRNADSMYRNFVTLVSPLSGADDTAPYMVAISEATSFVDVARKIKTISAAILQQKLATEAEEKEDPAVNDVLNVLTAVDNRLTNMINLFLKVGLGLTATIDSFTDDVESLFGYLHKKDNLDRALTEYEKEIMPVLNITVEPGTRAQINEYYGSPADHAGAPFVENVSITHLVMNSKQLGWKIGDEPLTINRSTAPSLYSIVESLDRHKKEIDGGSTLYDYLVSTDGVMYRVYRDYITMGQYMISLA